MNMIPLSALDRPIAYHRIFRKVSGSTVAAVFLSQAWYWSQRIPEGRDGWFYKKQTEWEDETGLSRSEQETARKKLVQLGILEEKREGLPAVLWYRINTDQLSRLIRDELGNAGTPQSSFSDTRNPDAVIPATIHTENTTETTVEKRPARRRTTPLPKDFTLTEELLNIARKKGLQDAVTRREFEKFCAYAEANDKRYVKWDKAWANWVMNRCEWDNITPPEQPIKPASEMTEAERIQAEIDEENREKRMYGAERVQWFMAKHARLDEIEKEQG